MSSIRVNLLILIISAIPFIASSEQVEKISTIANAQVKERANPKYPLHEARNGYNGWVQLSFVIEKDGSVSNPIIIDSSGSRGFEKSALKSVKKWQYTPATENGEPIQQCDNTVQLDFQMVGQQKDIVTKKFQRQYASVQDTLAAGDIELASAEIEKLEKRAKLHGGRMRVALAKAQLAELNENKKLAYKNYVKAFNEGGRIISKEAKVGLLNRLFTYEISVNELSKAKQRAMDIIEGSENQEIIATYTNFLNKINAFIDSRDNIILNADIETKDAWGRSLLRNEFLITNVEGSIHKVDIRCQNKHHVFSFVKDNIWKIPESWQQCSVFVYGDDHTTFSLVELPKTLAAKA